MSVIDFNKRRFDAAKDCTEISPADALRELLRQIESGETDAESVVICALVKHPDGWLAVDTVHGGPASTNERIGILSRAQHALMSGGYE